MPSTAGWESLAEAIAIQAARDYKESAKMRKEVEEFFTSEWCEMLIGHKIDGRYIIRRLKEGFAS